MKYIGKTDTKGAFRWSGLAGLALTLGFSGNALSQEANWLLECTGCGQNGAGEIALAWGFGEYVVFDHASLGAYRVEVISDPSQAMYGDSGGHSLVAQVTSMPLSTADIQQFQRLLVLRAQNGGSMKFNFELHPERPDYPGNVGPEANAHDVVRDNGYREALGSVISGAFVAGPTSPQPSLLRDVFDTLKWARDRIERFFGAEGLTMVVKFVFHDGSSAQFRFDKDNTAAAKYIPGSARDREGNVLPDESNARPGMPDQNNSLGIPQTFESSDTINEWLESAAIYGIRVVDLNGLPQGPGSVTVGGGGTISCGMSDGAMVCILVAQ